MPSARFRRHGRQSKSHKHSQQATVDKQPYKQRLFLFVCCYIVVVRCLLLFVCCLFVLLLLFIVVCCCLLLFVVVYCCCLLLFVCCFIADVCCCSWRGRRRLRRSSCASSRASACGTSSRTHKTPRFQSSHKTHQETEKEHLAPSSARAYGARQHSAKVENGAPH